jgi:sirohydrochlorin ferrochelatase
MKALLLAAHGSRREQSNREVEALGKRLQDIARPEFSLVGTGFLELAQPSISDALECCIRQGAEEIVVLPYFLAAGRHVVNDVPEEVAPVRARHPEVKIRITPHLGSADLLPSLLLGLGSRG